MTALLINMTVPGGSAASRTGRAGPAILEAEGSGSVVRFGETLRTHASDDPAQPTEDRVIGDGLPAPGEIEGELQIDDGDILGQIIGTHPVAAAGAPVTVGTEPASSGESNGTSEEGALPVSLVHLVFTDVELPSRPTGPAPAAADVTQGVGSVHDAAGALSGAQPRWALNVASSTVAASFVAEDSSAPARLSLSQPVSAPRIADIASMGSGATSGADPQGPNLLASQSQPLLLALASGTADAVKTAGAVAVADAQASTPDRQALVDALGERLSVQLHRGTSQATIRLDPPMMGTIEIVIRHDAAGVHVHLSATHGDVLRQLQGIGHALSQDLVQRHHGEVTVHVSESPRDGEGRHRHRQDDSAEGDSTPGHALRLPDEAGRAIAFTLA